MRAFRLVVAATAGFLTYLALVYFLGGTGVVAYQRLSGYRAELNSNLEQLSKIGTDLDERVSSLQSDSENVRLMSRSLGYYRNGEQVIRFAGRPVPQQVTSPGRLLIQPPDPADHRPLYRAIAVCVALFTLLISFFDVLQPSRDRNAAGGRGRTRAFRAGSSPEADSA